MLAVNPISEGIFPSFPRGNLFSTYLLSKNKESNLFKNGKNVSHKDCYPISGLHKSYILI